MGSDCFRLPHRHTWRVRAARAERVAESAMAKALLCVEMQMDKPERPKYVATRFNHGGDTYTQQFKMFTDAIRWSLRELQPGDRADIFLEGNLVWTKHL